MSFLSVQFVKCISNLQLCGFCEFLKIIYLWNICKNILDDSVCRSVRKCYSCTKYVRVYSRIAIYASYHSTIGHSNFILSAIKNSLNISQDTLRHFTLHFIDLNLNFEKIK